MQNYCPPEERYPLLLLFLEDGQRHGKGSRRIFFDKNRYQGITSGVTTVLTQWPGHITSCFTTALFIAAITIVIFMLMMIMSITPPGNFLTTRCKKHIYQQNLSTTVVHLVHGPNSWTQYQLDTFEDIVKGYGSSNIDLILIQNKKAPNVTTNIKSSRSLLKTLMKNTTMPKNVSQYARHSRIKRNVENPFQFNINFGATDFIRMLMDQTSSLAEQIKSRANYSSVKNNTKETLSITDLIHKYPNISVRNVTYEEVFKRSPLFFTWKNLNEATRLFAVRVMQIWNYAGITFDLPDIYENKSSEYQPQNVSNDVNEQDLKKYKNLIGAGLPFFDNMPEGLVTVDEKGLHMETKTVCHAFFGEILMKLRNSKNGTFPAVLIQDTLKSFCIKGAVDINYCRKLYDTEKWY